MPGKLAEIRDRCGGDDPPKRLTCLIDSMRADGATLEALAFTLSLGSDAGYMAQFRSAGPVDIVVVPFPFSKDRIFGVLVVNGNPPLFDPDAPNILGNLAEDAAARNLLPPDAIGSVKPSAHTIDNFPFSRRLPGGAVDLVMDYSLPLKEGSARLFARLRFDQNGKFLTALTQNVLSAQLIGGSNAKTSLHYKEGDIFQVAFNVFDGDSASVASEETQVVQELGRSWFSTMCASPCVDNYIWTFEAVGRGETSLVFTTAHDSKTVGVIFQPSEYRVHVD